jgi:hypothetical protein
MRRGFNSHCDSRKRNRKAAEAAKRERPCRPKSTGQMSGQRVRDEPARVRDRKLCGEGPSALIARGMGYDQSGRGDRNQRLTCAIQRPQEPEDTERRHEPTRNQAGRENDSSNQNCRGGPTMPQRMANRVARRLMFHPSGHATQNERCRRRSEIPCRSCG